MIESILPWLIQYSSVLEFTSSIMLTALVAVLSYKQYKLNKMTVDRPEWRVDEMDIGGDKKECYGSIILENIGGKGKDVTVPWVTCNGNYNGERIPTSESKEGSETTLRKSAHPGDTIKIPVEFENIDKMDNIMVNVSSEEISDLINIEPKKLMQLIEN